MLRPKCLGERMRGPCFGTTSHSAIRNPKSAIGWWSAEMRLMNLMCCGAMLGRPGLDFFRQNSRNFFLLHLMTVSGLTMTSADRQDDQTRDNRDQNRRSRLSRAGRFCFRL